MPGTDLFILGWIRTGITETVSELTSSNCKLYSIFSIFLKYST